MANPAPPIGRAWRAVVAFRVTPRQFRLLCLATVWALALTIEVGAAVRLTGSGLSCPDWPACTGHSLVAPLQFHPWMEFANRLFNGTVTVGCIAVPLAAWRRGPKRRDLLWLSGLLLLGLFAEVVLGGLTVLNDLAPGFVMAHFLLGAAFLGVSVVLHHRSSLPDAPDPDRPGWSRLAGKPVLLVPERVAYFS
ncbi:MAG: COX15/CtaA family protein, partial [Acidimicrobiales bacterium]